MYVEFSRLERVNVDVGDDVKRGREDERETRNGVKTMSRDKICYGATHE
jgi:hypothetical protein